MTWVKLLAIDKRDFTSHEITVILLLCFSVDEVKINISPSNCGFGL